MKPLTGEQAGLKPGHIYNVMVPHRRKARKMLVRVIDKLHTEYIGCEIIGGDTTDLLHKGLRVIVPIYRFNT